MDWRAPALQVGDLVRIRSLPGDTRRLPDDVERVFARAVGQVFRVQDVVAEGGAVAYALWVSEEGTPTDSPLHDTLFLPEDHLEPVAEDDYDREF